MRGRAVRKRGEGSRTSHLICSFDLLFLNGRDLRPLPLLERKARLRKLIGKDRPRLRYVDHIDVASSQEVICEQWVRPSQ
jgi:ATP-dependent DNA ligase